MKTNLLVILILAVALNSCAASPAKPIPPTLDVLESGEVIQTDSTPTQLPHTPTQNPTATSTSTPVPTSTPTPLPPGVTGDDYTPLAISGHYMHYALSAINYTGNEATIDAVALSPDGSYVAIGGCIRPALSQCPDEVVGGRPFLVILDSGTGDLITNIPVKNSTITSVMFTLDSQKLISSLIPFEVKVWDVKTGKAERTIIKEDAQRAYYKIQLSPDGTQLAIVQRDRLLVLNVDTGEVIARVPAVRIGSDLPLYNVDGSRILVFKSAEPYALTVYDTSTWEPVSTIDLPNSSSVAFSPDGRQVVTVDNASPRGLFVWDADNGGQIARLPETYEQIFGITIAPDTGLLYVNGYGGPDDLGGLSVWDIQTQKRLGVLFDFDETSRLRFSPDGQYLLSSNYTQVWMWKPITDRVIADRQLALAFYDALSRADYQAAAAMFQPGEYESGDYLSPAAGADLASQLKLACEQGRIICLPILRILPGGGMTVLGDDIVYLNFRAEDGSVYKTPSGFTNLYVFAGPAEDGSLKLSYLPVID